MPEENFECPEGLKDNEERFAIWFYEGILSRQPRNVEALVALANLYTKTGLYEKGLELDKRLLQLRANDPIVHYNLACSYSLLGQIEKALKAMGRAITLGYRDVEYMEEDPDLSNIRTDPRFGEMVKRLKRS